MPPSTSLLLPPQSLHQELLHTLGALDRQADSLVRGVVSARKADHCAQAATSMYRLRGLLLQQQQRAQQDEARRGGGGGRGRPGWVGAMLAPGASWQVEEAKLLWAQGQWSTAVQLARGLLAAR